jgi:hypothetical protein
MHNLALILILAETRRRQCPCGAVPDRPFGLCRKCQNRKAWRRKTTTPRRKTGRRGFARRVHRDALALLDALAMFPTISNGLGT